MSKFIIYNLLTGYIKSVITTSNALDNDVPDGYGYIESNESVEGMVVDLSSSTLVETTVDLPYALTFLGKLKRERNAYLLESDWTQFPDSPLSDAKKVEWTTYRQALRDIPETYSDATSLNDIIWPTKPR
tara:strand:+ start:1303 stop:1692 length:390 start_codon:yes stop_codon:yes gene_type:complete